MSHVDLLTNIYDEDLDYIHDLIGILCRLDDSSNFSYALVNVIGVRLMRLEGKQGEL